MAACDSFLTANPFCAEIYCGGQGWNNGSARPPSRPPQLKAAVLRVNVLCQLSKDLKERERHTGRAGSRPPLTPLNYHDGHLPHSSPTRYCGSGRGGRGETATRTASALEEASFLSGMPALGLTHAPGTLCPSVEPKWRLAMSVALGSRVPSSIPRAGRRAGTKPIHFTLLGGFQLRHDGNLVVLPLPAERPLAVVALRDRPLLRPYIAGVLWSDATEGQAAGNLRCVLWKLTHCGIRLIERSKGHLSP
jgi:hypothetical protein